MVVGCAFAVSPLAEILRVADGDHEYVLAPLAVSLIPVPRQIYALFGVTLMVGLGSTVTCTASVAEQLLELVVVRKYVCIVVVDPVVNDTVGLDEVVELKPVPGVHE